MKGIPLLIVAGEVSGDQHAGAVLRHLRRMLPEVQPFGLGGEELAAAGLEILHHVRELAVLGFTEVLGKYAFFRGVFRRVIRECEVRDCRHALLVDYPGFNLALAKVLQRRGVKVLYFICPQVWAWGSGRIRLMARVIDRLLVIFPFEPDVFRGTGLRVDFVGHPLVDRIPQTCKREVQWHGTPRVLLLPGSRRQEVISNLPVMLEAAELIRGRFPGAGFVAAAPDRGISRLVQEICEARSFIGGIGLVEGRAGAALRSADVAMIASGTATVEAALARCPMVIVYRTAWFTYWLGRMVISVPHLGMVNLIAGRELCPEFLQVRAQGRKVGEAVVRLLTDTAYRDEMLRGLEEVSLRLGPPGAAERVAEIVTSELLNDAAVP
ncbi:MAG TPA: lipid-A-disaccharide synthase [Kiritimatiellae bacterium]|nr:lipid-A-disaccharide synthase [Kiritimatiellia bacterium]